MPWGGTSAPAEILYQHDLDDILVQLIQENPAAVGGDREAIARDQRIIWLENLSYPVRGEAEELDGPRGPVVEVDALACQASRSRPYHRLSASPILTWRRFARAGNDRTHGTGTLLQTWLAFRRMRKVGRMAR
jgi:hypothetical protein